MIIRAGDFKAAAHAPVIAKEEFRVEVKKTVIARPFRQINRFRLFTRISLGQEGR
jgi:hypothetical protein